MGYTLRTGLPAGRIDSDELGSFEIEENELEVDDYETAAALVSRYNVEWSDGDPEDGEEDRDDGTPSTDDATPDETDSGYGENETTEETNSSEIESGYTEEDLREMDRGELQSLATESDNPDIDGRSSNEDIISGLMDSEE